MPWLGRSIPGATSTRMINTKNLGNLALSAFLIYFGLSTLIPAIGVSALLAILAIAAGVLLLLGK